MTSARTPGRGSTTASSTSACTPRPTRRRARASTPATRRRARLAAAALPRVGRRRRRGPGRGGVGHETLRALRDFGFTGPSTPSTARGRAVAACPRTDPCAICPARSTWSSSPYRPTVPGVLADAAAVGARAAVVLSSGFGEAGPEGRPRQARTRPAGARARHPAGRTELPRRPQHRPRGPAERQLRPGAPPAGGLAVAVPVRRGRHRAPRQRHPHRLRHLHLRLARQQGRRQRQRPDRVLVRRPGDPGGGALPRVVRQPAQVRPDRAGAGPPQAGARRQERPLRRRAAAPAPPTPPRRRPRTPPWTRCSRRPAWSAPTTSASCSTRPGCSPTSRCPPATGSPSSATPADSTSSRRTRPRARALAFPRSVPALQKRWPRPCPARPAATTRSTSAPAPHRGLRGRRGGCRRQRRDRQPAPGRHRHPRQRRGRHPGRARSGRRPAPGTDGGRGRGRRHRRRRRLSAIDGAPVFDLPEQAVGALGHAARYAAWRREPLGRRPDLSGVDPRRARALVRTGARRRAPAGSRTTAPPRSSQPTACRARHGDRRDAERAVAAADRRRLSRRAQVGRSRPGAQDRHRRCPARPHDAAAVRAAFDAVAAAGRPGPRRAGAAPGAAHRRAGGRAGPRPRSSARW